ncbi:MAG TPA: tetratricopeptide repeat protein [Caldithrix sp.]|nr:tetratricopeptide repeat protein [Calditrichaceae bacterium]HEM48746.1 tetratricopeptide repeat protein [Caldithrix sp.]
MDVIKRLFLISFIIAQSVTAANLHDVFNQGNQYYQQGEYEQAIESYQKIIEEGYESGPLYFNLGNAYYKLGQLGPARLYYERASEYLKNDEALQENMQLLNLRLVDQIEPMPQFFLNAVWTHVVDFIAIDMLIWIVTGLLWLSLVVFSIRYYFRSRGRGDRFKILFAFIFVIFIFFALISIQKIYNLENEQYGIIMKSSVTSRAEPKISATEVFIIHEGTKVKIERVTGDWYEVRLADGKTGWLERTYLEII